jgi:CoA:oxalate CoA-transferase
VSLADPAMKDLRLAGNPIKLSAHADPSVRAGAPALDADRRQLLEDF